MERQPILFELMDRQKTMMNRHKEALALEEQQHPVPLPPQKAQSPYHSRVVLDPYASSDNDDYYNDDPIPNSTDSPIPRDMGRSCTSFNKPVTKQFQFPKVGHESDNSIRSYESEDEHSVSGQNEGFDHAPKVLTPNAGDNPDSRPPIAFSSISESSDRDSPSASLLRSARNGSPDSGIRKKALGGLENVLNKIKLKQLTVPGSIRGRGSDTEGKPTSQVKSGYVQSDSEDSCASSVCFKPSKRKGLARRVHEHSLYSYKDEDDADDNGDYDYDDDDDDETIVTDKVSSPKNTEDSLSNDQLRKRGGSSSSFTSGTPESVPTPEPEPVLHTSPPGQLRVRAAMQMPSSNPANNKSLSQVTGNSRFDTFQARSTPDGSIMACRYCPYTKPIGPGCMVAIRKHEQCHFAKGTYKCPCCTFSTININTFRLHQQLHVDAGDCTEESMRESGPKRRRARKQMPKTSLPKCDRGVTPSTQALLKHKLTRGSGSEEGHTDDADNHRGPKHSNHNDKDYSLSQRDSSSIGPPTTANSVYSSMTESQSDQISNYPVNSNQVQNSYQSNDNFNYRYSNYNNSGPWRGYNPPTQSPVACEKPGAGGMHHSMQNQMYQAHTNDSWHNNNVPSGYQNTPNYYGHRNNSYDYSNSAPDNIQQCNTGHHGYNNLSPNNYRNTNGGYYMSSEPNNYSANTSYGNSSQSSYPTSRTNSYRCSTPVNYGHPGYTNLSPTGYNNTSPVSGHYQDNNNPWPLKYPARQPADYHHQQVPNYHNYTNSYESNACSMTNLQKPHSMHHPRDTLHSPDSLHSTYNGQPYGPIQFAKYGGSASANESRNKLNCQKSPSPIPYEPATTPVSSASPSSHHEDEAIDLSSSQKTGLDGRGERMDLDSSAHGAIKPNALDLTKHQNTVGLDSSAEYYHSETQALDPESVRMSGINGAVGGVNESPENITWDLSSVRASLKKTGMGAPVKKIARKYKAKAAYKTKVHCCQFCPFKSGGHLSSKAVVAKHQKCHATKRRYACDLCNYNTDCSKNIRLHIELHPAGDANILINGKQAVLRKRKARVKATMPAKKTAKIFQNADGPVIPAPTLQNMPDIGTPEDMGEAIVQKAPQSIDLQNDEKSIISPVNDDGDCTAPPESLPSVDVIPSHDLVNEDKPEVPKQKVTLGKTERTPKRGGSRPVEIIKCLYCPLTVTTVSPAARYNLKRHQQCHSIKGRFTCTKCSYSAQYMDHMKRHRQLHIKEDGVAPPIRQGKRLLPNKAGLNSTTALCEDNASPLGGNINDEVEFEEDATENLSDATPLERADDENVLADVEGEVSTPPSPGGSDKVPSQTGHGLEDIVVDTTDPFVNPKAGKPKVKRGRKKNAVKDHASIDPSFNNQCRYCPFTTGSTTSARFNMARHERAHFMRGTFMCEICNFGCFVEWRLRKHKQLHEKFDQKQAAISEAKNQEHGTDSIEGGHEITTVLTNPEKGNHSLDTPLNDDATQSTQASTTNELSGSHEVSNQQTGNELSEDCLTNVKLFEENKTEIQNLEYTGPTVSDKPLKVRKKRRKKRKTLNLRKKQSKASRLGLVGRGGYLKKFIAPLPSLDHTAGDGDASTSMKPPFSESLECDSPSISSGIQHNGSDAENSTKTSLPLNGDDESESQLLDSTSIKQNTLVDQNENGVSLDKNLCDSVDDDKKANTHIVTAMPKDNVDDTVLPNEINEEKVSADVITQESSQKIIHKPDEVELPQSKRLKAQSVFAFTENDSSDFENDSKTKRPAIHNKRIFGRRLKKAPSLPHTEQRLTCLYCPFQVSSPNNAARHHLALHENCHFKKSKFKCQQCTFTGKSPSSIHKHSQVHKPDYNPNPTDTTQGKLPQSTSGCLEESASTANSECTPPAGECVSVLDDKSALEPSHVIKPPSVVNGHQPNHDAHTEKCSMVNETVTDQAEDTLPGEMEVDRDDKTTESSQNLPPSTELPLSTVASDINPRNAKTLLKRKILGRRKKGKRRRTFKRTPKDNLNDLSPVGPAEVYNLTNIDGDGRIATEPAAKCSKVSVANGLANMLKQAKDNSQELTLSQGGRCIADAASTNDPKEKSNGSAKEFHSSREVSDKLHKEQALEGDSSNAASTDASTNHRIPDPASLNGDSEVVPDSTKKDTHSIDAVDKSASNEDDTNPEVNRKSMHVDHMYTKAPSKAAPVRHNTRRSPKAKLKMAMILDAERNGGMGMDPSHLGYITGDSKPPLLVKAPPKRVSKPKSAKTKPVPQEEMVPRLLIRYKCGECLFTCCDTRSLEQHVATCHQTPDGVSSKALSNIEIKVEHIMSTSGGIPTKTKSILNNPHGIPLAMSAPNLSPMIPAAFGNDNKASTRQPNKKIKLGLNRAIKTAPGVKAAAQIAGSPSKCTTLTDALEELRTSMPGVPNKDADMIFTVRAPKKASANSKRMLEIPADLWKLDGQYRCQWCDFICKREHYFKIHLYCHQRRRAKHRCKRCGYGATRPAFLEQHILQHHLPEGGNVSNAEPKDLFFAVRERLWDRGLDERVLIQLAGPKSDVPPSFVMPEPSPEVGPPSSPRDGSPRKPSVKGKKRRWNSALPAGTSVDDAPAPKLRCSLCPFATSSVEVQTQHANKHRKVERFSCPYCTYSTRTRVYLEKHVKLHFTAHVQKTALEHLPVACGHFDMEKQLKIKEHAACDKRAEAAVTGTKRTDTSRCRYCGLQMDKDKLDSHEYRHLVGCGYLHNKPDVLTEL